MNERRHELGSHDLAGLTAYGLDRDRLAETTGSAWAFARDFGPPIVGVARSLERLGDGMGLPPVEFGPDVPFFEGRKRTKPIRHRDTVRIRDHGITGD